MMSMPTDQIAVLERLNYEATLAVAQVTPGLDLCLKDHVIITSSQLFPAPDTTHACLLRTGSERADKLIDEIISYFQERELPLTVFLSPACTPLDLPERLLKRGFIKNQEEEAWLVIEDLFRFKIPALSPQVQIKRITSEEAGTFARTFMASYEMPPELAEPMAQLIEPSVGLAGMNHYLGFADQQPIATFSLICHKNIGVLGSAGVLPDYRGSKIAANLLFNAELEAKKQGINTLLLQTTADTLLEKGLRIHGFRRAFKRTSYTQIL